MNIINIKAKKIPQDDYTKSILSFKQGDDLAFRVGFFSETETPLSLEGISSLVFEIYDIGSYQSPSPRKSNIVLQKILDSDSINNSLTLEDWNNGDSQHAIFNVAAEESSLEYGEKWLRIYARLEDDKTTTLSAGWIEVEENFSSYETVTSTEVEEWKNIAQSSAESAQSYAESASESTAKALEYSSSASESAEAATAQAEIAKEAISDLESIQESIQAYAESAQASENSASDAAETATAQAELALQYAQEAENSSNGSAYVHIEGEETITGAKTFTSPVNIGATNTTTNTNCLSIGVSNSNSSRNSMVGGDGNSNAGTNSIISGSSNTNDPSSGGNSIITGVKNSTTGIQSMICGYLNSVAGNDCIASGSKNFIGSNAHDCIISGTSNKITANTNNSAVFGTLNEIEANNDNSFIVGKGNKISNNNRAAFGTYNKVLGDDGSPYKFTFGNGSDDNNRSNGLALDNDDNLIISGDVIYNSTTKLSDTFSIVDKKQTSLESIISTKADQNDVDTNLQSLAQNSAKQGKFYLNAGAMYATVDLLGTYFESFSICATIDSSYTGTIFSYGEISSETDDDGNTIDTSSYFMAQVSSSSIVVSSSTNGDLISYDCSDLTSENRALVFASNGTTLTLYINGLAAATATLASDVPSGDNTLIFGSYANTSYFPYAYGQMWNIKVFNFDLNCDNTLYTAKNYASGDLQKTLLNQSLICGSDSALGSTSGTWNITYTTQASRYSSTIGKWKNGSYTVWLKNLNEEELKQDDIPFANAGVSIGGSVAYNASTGSQTIYTEEHSYTKGDLLRIKFKLRRNILDGYSYDSSYTSIRIGVNKISLFDDVGYFKIINTESYTNQWGEIDFYAIIPRDASFIQIFAQTPLPVYNDDGEIIAPLSYFIADFEIERLGSKLDLMDFSVAENDSTRQVKDGSINQNDMTITGNLSGNKDPAMDNYQSYIITQAIQELNLTSE